MERKNKDERERERCSSVGFDRADPDESEKRKTNQNLINSGRDCTALVSTAMATADTGKHLYFCAAIAAVGRGDYFSTTTKTMLAEAEASTREVLQ